MPDASLVDSEPRVDPRLKAYLKVPVLKGEPPTGRLWAGSYEKLISAIQRNAKKMDEKMGDWKNNDPQMVETAEGMGALGMMAPMVKVGQTLPKPPAEVKALYSKEGLEISTKECVSAPDGNTVKILLCRPQNAGSEPLPLVVYYHGGGMAMGSAFDPGHAAWGRFVARSGNVATALVDFRNSTTPSQSNPEVKPYPAGLNDCYAGLKWCFENAASIGVDPKRIIVAGESGGGNLTIATALKCKKENRLDMLSGFYALCPMVAGTWPHDESENGSVGTAHLPEVNNGWLMYLGGTKEMSNAAIGYDGGKALREKDPLAWPGIAQVDDLKGLPRCVVSVNDCDPLRDDGIQFYRKLMQAGVPASARNVMGTIHAGDLCMANVPEIALETARSIANFARGGPTAKL